MNRILFCISALMMVLMISCSDDMSENEKDYDGDDDGVVIALSINKASLQKCCQDLAFMESVDIPVSASFPGTGDIGGGDTADLDIYIPTVCTVTNMGNQRTLWKYGVGENLVPDYLCGTSLNDMTISTLYKYSVKYYIEGDYTLKGLTGPKSGWDRIFINNSQEKKQYGFDNTPEGYMEYYTYVYDIITSIKGYTIPNGHCWVPCNTDEVAVYIKVYKGS